jgi:hypothetical protein
MSRLTIALLVLGVGMATATTARTGWWAGCNPEASLCRLLSGSDPPVAPAYVAPPHQRSMYMYAPRHGTRTHRTSANSRY